MNIYTRTPARQQEIAASEHHRQHLPRHGLCGAEQRQVQTGDCRTAGATHGYTSASLCRDVGENYPD